MPLFLSIGVSVPAVLPPVEAGSLRDLPLDGRRRAQPPWPRSGTCWPAPTPPPPLSCPSPPRRRRPAHPSSERETEKTDRCYSAYISVHAGHRSFPTITSPQTRDPPKTCSSTPQVLRRQELVDLSPSEDPCPEECPLRTQRRELPVKTDLPLDPLLYRCFKAACSAAWR